MAIPRIMHQIWIQGQSELPEKYHAYQASWKAVNPDWKYQMWDEQKMQDFLRFNYDPSVLDIFNRGARLLHQKVDLFKHLVLYKVGGAYLDMDTMALRPLDDLLAEFPDKRVLISDGPGNTLEYMVSFGHPKMYNNGILISAPGHPLYRDFLNEMLDALKRGCSDNASKFRCINQTTGPLIFSKVIGQYASRYPDVALISRKYLEPCHGSDPYCHPEPESIANHRHTLTWLSGGTTTALWAYFTLRHFAPLIVALVLLYYLVLAPRSSRA